jgi:Thioredoxin
VKKSSMMAVHFYRPTTARCAIVNAKLEKLAPKHVETRFCRIDAEKSPYLVDKLTITVMPTILLICGGQTVHQIRGFDELGGSDDFHEDTLAFVMAQWGCCTYEVCMLRCECLVAYCDGASY